MRTCHNGAGCVNPSCTFQHPPNRPPFCGGGAHCAIPRCHLLHPLSRCKFGLQCSNPACSRWHPAPGAQGDAVAALAPPFFPLRGAVAACQLGGNCKSITCNLLHPAERPAICNDGVECGSRLCQLLHPPGRRALCTFGASCTNIQCNDEHPPDRSPVCDEGASCPNLDCPALHPKRNLCSRGASCLNYSCSKRHPPERTACCECEYSDCDLLHAYGRASSCHFGSDCRRQRTCTYLHPMPRGVRERRERLLLDLRRQQSEEAERAHRAKLEAELAQQADNAARVAERKQELADIQAKNEAVLREQRRLEQIALRGTVAAEEEAVLALKPECCVCFDECRPTDGVSCVEMHFLCDGCFDRYVLETATRDDRLARGSDVQCPSNPCGAACFSDKQVAEHVSEETFRQLCILREELHEQTIVAQVEARLEAEMKRREQLSVIERAAADARHHIVENILTLKCPKCKAAFVDFVGCFALTCAACPCQFCAWCLQAGSDGPAAHRCAAQCGTKHGADGYYGTKELFETYHNGRKRDAAKAFLLQLDGAVQAASQEACRSELEALGVEFDVATN